MSSLDESINGRVVIPFVLRKRYLLRCSSDQTCFLSEGRKRILVYLISRLFSMRYHSTSTKRDIVVLYSRSSCVCVVFVEMLCCDLLNLQPNSCICGRGLLTRLQQQGVRATKISKSWGVPIILLFFVFFIFR